MEELTLKAGNPAYDRERIYFSTEPIIMTDLAAVDRYLGKTSPSTILHWAVETYGDELAVVTSFQPSGIVILHMLQTIAPETTVLTLDTGVLFPETYALMDEVEQAFHLNLIRIKPSAKPMWEQDVDACCQYRKVVPLGEALDGFEAWITGLRRDQSASRAAIPVVERDKKYHKVKIAPLATWTEEMVWTYIRAHALPYNSLHDQGYPSIGCLPCTQAIDPETSDRRAGRWQNLAKTECGIHR
jgi:phosphoadenosine phosphosulfate reductase